MLHTTTPSTNSQCRICNAPDSDYTLMTKWYDGKNYLQAQSPVCGSDQCVADLTGMMSARIVNVVGDVDVEFTLENNNDDPF